MRASESRRAPVKVGGGILACSGVLRAAFLTVAEKSDDGDEDISCTIITREA